MPVDNDLYDRLADTWWDERGFLNILRWALNPVRFGYFTQVLTERLRWDVRGKSALDIGCGGGLLAEEFARLGCRVVGIDPSVPSLEVAKAHARKGGLEIVYVAGVGETIPCADASIDIAYCCDVLEHVDDLDRVVAETARVLKPGGVYLFDTINRTLRSKLVMIKLFQEWNATRLMEPGTHDWSMFIKPRELIATLARHGIASREVTGAKPGASPFRVLRALRRHRRGKLSYAEVGRRIALVPSRDTSILYLGYALKMGGASSAH
jgi:2-polyprenyl-6-hydroxyphenyl methylase / 3-demethylubiquinone-9 3-methyltransferase